MRFARFIFAIALLSLLAIESDASPVLQNPSAAYRITRNITHNGVSVDIVIDKPKGVNLDTLIVYHGTVNEDSRILEAANNVLNAFKGITDNRKMMIVSVAYPEENLLFGDNIVHSEAALLWIKNRSRTELGINVRKIFLAGHSQGGYLVTRLNTMHETDGVIANGPGPLNLVFRCGLEETGQAPQTPQCTLLRNTYGTTVANPDAYWQRSLRNFTTGHKSRILFVQGLDDSLIQLYSWPSFKLDLTQCEDCSPVEFLDLAGFGHSALFNSPQARTAFNQFIQTK
jgi:poly(3-hydroxybutyrate) depolymerase